MRFVLAFAVLLFGCHHSAPVAPTVVVQAHAGLGAVCGDNTCDFNMDTLHDVQPECFTCPKDCAAPVPFGPHVGWVSSDRACDSISCGDGICNGDECNPNSVNACAADCHAGDWTWDPTTYKCTYKTTCGDGWCYNGTTGDECKGWNGFPNGAHMCLQDCPAFVFPAPAGPYNSVYWYRVWDPQTQENDCEYSLY